MPEGEKLLIHTFSDCEGHSSFEAPDDLLTKSHLLEFMDEQLDCSVSDLVKASDDPMVWVLANEDDPVRLVCIRREKIGIPSAPLRIFICIGDAA
jgi:hypothetical protein